MQRGEAWEPVARALAERYRVRCLDFTTWTFEERLGEILGTAKPQGAGVGDSMGGRIALHAALSDPAAFPALALVGVSAGIENRDERRRSDEELAAWIERHTIDEAVERWEAQPVFASQPPELVLAQRAGRLSHD